MARLLPCQACCPKTPGYPVGRVRHTLDFVEVDGVNVWAQVCDNCGNVKRPRKSNRPTGYDFVTKEATTDKGMSRPNSILFHVFNPNGLYATLRAAQDRVVEVIEKTGCPNGVLMVHGSLNDFPRAQLYKLLDRRNRTGREFAIEYAVTIRGVERAIRDANAWCDEKLAAHAAA